MSREQAPNLLLIQMLLALETFQTPTCDFSSLLNYVLVFLLSMISPGLNSSPYVFATGHYSRNQMVMLTRFAKGCFDRRQQSVPLDARV